MTFIPEQPKKAMDVPYFEDAKEADGWKGHTTGKSMEALKSEVTQAISRLGGMVTGFQKGMFNTDKKDRLGFRVHYAIDNGGKMVAGRIDVAALPNRSSSRSNYRSSSSLEKRQEQSLKMALYMLRDAIDGLRFLQILSPGYAPLMPFMMVDKDKTVSQLWIEGANIKQLMPPEGSGEFVEGEAREVK